MSRSRVVAENIKLRSFYKWGAYSQLLRQNRSVDVSTHFMDMESPLGFELQVKRSKIDRNGLGLFLKEGCAKRGEILAVYPGIVFHPGSPGSNPCTDFQFFFSFLPLFSNFKGL